MRRLLLSTLSLLVLPLSAQQPAKPAAGQARPPAAPPVRRELSEAERRAAQDARNAADKDAMQRQIAESQRRSEAARLEAARQKPSGAVQDVVKSTEAKEIKDDVTGMIKNRDTEGLTKAARDAIAEHGDEAKALAEKAKAKSEKLRDTASADKGDEPLPAAPLKVLTEPRVPRARPAAQTKYDLVADEIIMPMPKEEAPGSAAKATSVAQRTVNARGNFRIQGTDLFLTADTFDGVLKNGFSPASANSGKPKSGKAGDPVNAGSVSGGPSSETADFPFEKAVAIGKVYLKSRNQKGQTVIARAQRMTYDPATGAMILKGYPEAIEGQTQMIGREPDSIITVVPGKSITNEKCTIHILGADGKPVQPGGSAAPAASTPSARPPGT